MLDRETPVKSQTLFNVLPGLVSMRKMNARVLGLYFFGMLTRLREKSEFHNIVPTGVCMCVQRTTRHTLQNQWNVPPFKQPYV
jgi:hypothetical protein